MKKVLYTIQMLTTLSDEEYDILMEKLNNKRTWRGDEIDDMASQLYSNGIIDGYIEFLSENNDGLDRDIKLA